MSYVAVKVLVLNRSGVVSPRVWVKSNKKTVSSVAYLYF